MRKIVIVLLAACATESASDELCGDGHQDPDEACDDGNDRSGDGCWRCQIEADAACGDGKVQRSLEACDPGEPNLQACRGDCTLPACGDGAARAGDVCFDEARPLLPVSLDNLSLELADLDRDGRLDIVISRGGSTGAALEVAFADGGDAFTRVSVRLHDDTTGNVPLAIGDLDGNGEADIALADGTSLYVVKNRGARVLELDPAIQIASGLTDVAIGDVDGDDDADVIVANAFKSQVTVLPTTTLPFGVVQLATSVAVRELELGAFDDRAGLDIVALADDALTVVFVTATGPTTATFRTRSVPVTGTTQHALRVVNIDDDDLPDLVFVDQNVTHVLVARADRTSFDAFQTPGFSATELVDVDRDGKLDLVGSYQHVFCGSGLLDCTTADLYTAILLGHGDGTFGPEDPHLVRYSPDGAGCVLLCASWSLELRAGDLDRDGALDLVGFSFSPGLFGAGVAGELRLLHATP